VAYDGSYTMHAYGSSRAYVENLVLEDNIAFERGPFLVAVGRPSRSIRVFRNLLYGIDMRIGNDIESEDCELRENVLANGKIRMGKYRSVVDEANVRELPASKAVLLPNKYDPRRAHLALFNGARAAHVAVEPGSFLRPGDSFRILDARDFYGKPLLAGKYSGGAIPVPVAGEFAALVLLRE
jgi:hypothetical protein